jgi:uncharacterized protein YjbJ (UPF0337 family)
MMEGKTDELKGRVKEAAGDITDDRDLKNEGKKDKAAKEAVWELGATVAATLSEAR